MKRSGPPAPAGPAQAEGAGGDPVELQRRINDMHRRLAEISAAHGHRPPARLSDDDQAEAEADALAAEAHAHNAAEDDAP